MATVDDLIGIMQVINTLDNADIGESDNGQSNYIIFINRAMKELAHIAYRSRVSDELMISGDGYVYFQKSASNITDIYAPQRIMNAAETSEVPKRTAFSAPVGWWRESDGAAIHVRGLTSGSYKLHYIGYPTTVSATTDTLDFPEAGIMVLAYWCSALVKEASNSYDEAQAMRAIANKNMGVIVQANTDARGVSSGGYVPSQATLSIYRG